MIKEHKSKEYNWKLNTENGHFVRWGKTFEDNPEYSPVGAELIDCEISTICHGLGTPCPWCYKSNTPNGKNMSLETFKKIFKKLPENVQQIAFGVGTLEANPDTFAIFEYCKDHGVTPNVTINGYQLTDEQVSQLVILCGAVAVSMYEPKDYCYNAVKRLTDAGLKQCNIHKLLAKETVASCFELFEDVRSDERLSKLNAIVFLGLKQRGKRNKFEPATKEQFKLLVGKAFELGMPIGFDSCSAYKFLDAVRERSDYKKLEMLCEPCESSLFSLYINVEGRAFPCSFTEDGEGIDVVNCKDFLKDVWFNEKSVSFREELLKTAQNDLKCRRCPRYNI